MPLANIPDFIPALPEIFLALASLVLLMVGVFHQDKNRHHTVGVLATAVLLLAVVWVVAYGSAPAVTMNGLFVTGPFIGFAKVLIFLACGLTLYLSLGYLRRYQDGRFEYGVLVVTAALGMGMMVSSNDLMSLYMGLETQSLSLYVLASYQRDRLRSTEAGIKYFILGAVASGMLLYGASLVYGFTGTTNFTTLASLFGSEDFHGPETGLIIGLVFIVAGLAFKVSAVPFHMWTPDVYEGAATPVTAFFAVAPKIAAIILFTRVLVGPFGPLQDQWQQIIVLISLLSMVLGAFAAVVQTNIKRLMAYSSIGHVGYALIGLAVGNEIGVRAILVYMAIYLFMNLGTFACILAMRRGGDDVEDIDDLAGLARNQPLMAAVMAVFMFSMAGIPPLAGFFGKLYIFMAAIEAKLYLVAIIGVLSSVVAAFYYIRIIKVMYFDEPAEPFDRPYGIEITSVLTATGLIVLLFFIFPDPIVDGAAQAASALFRG